MAKLRKTYSIVWEIWAKKSIFGQKRPNFGQKRPKKSKTRIFLQNFFSPFFKRPKIGSYGKNQENLQQRLGEMGQKEHFWPKTAKFWPKTTKKSKTRKKISPYFKRPKNQFLCQKSETFKVAFGRKGPKRAFLAKNGQILTKNGQKVENENFRTKNFFAIF